MAEKARTIGLKAKRIVYDTGSKTYALKDGGAGVINRSATELIDDSEL